MLSMIGFIQGPSFSEFQTDSHSPREIAAALEKASVVMVSASWCNISGLAAFSQCLLAYQGYQGGSDRSKSSAKLCSRFLV